MIQKLLLFFRSFIFFKLNSFPSSGKSFVPSIKLFCLGLFFVISNNYGQCNTYPAGITKIGADQFFCIDGTNPLTVSLRAQQYVAVNVIKGYNYTFSVPNIWGTSGGSNIEYLGLFDDAAGNTYLTQNNTTNGASITWTATLTGKIRVLLLRNNNCSTTTDNTASAVTLTLNSVGDSSTIDSQTAFGIGSWKGHVYNFTGGTPPGGASPTTLSEGTYPFITGLPANYAGYYDVGAEAFPAGFNFGGDNDTTCFDVYSEGNVRGSILTHNFAVRYRMQSNRPAGCYVVKITGDDGVRLYINNRLVFDRWVQQSPTSYYYILVNLPANANLVFDYYENTGNNQVNFQIDPFDPSSNIITAPAVVNFCPNGDPAVIDGTFKYNDLGTEMDNPYINYQWKVSTNGGAYINVSSNGNSRTYDPPAIANGTGANIITKYKRIATVNPVNAVGVTCTFDESNEVTFITSPNTQAQPGVISGTTTQCSSLTGQVYSVSPVANATRYIWSVPTGWSITSGAGTNSITVTTGTTGQNGNIVVQAANACATSTVRNLPVTVTPGSIGGSIAGSTSVCSATNSTALTLSGHTGTIVRWESSTDDFATVINSIPNTTSNYTATNVGVTTSYRAVIQNGSCSIAYSISAYITVNKIVITDASVCQGGSGNIIASPAYNLGLVISGTWTSTNPVAVRPNGTINSTTCDFTTATNRNYVATPFQVSATGVYILEMNANTAYDGMGYIGSGAYTPGTCTGFVIGDDDSGTDREPKMTVLLTAGVSYTLVSTTWDATPTTGGFSWKITPPAGGEISTTVNWYTAASGGSPIATGSPFNPVGVTGSGLTNTNTPGTTAYYAAYPSDPSCRTLANFVINPLLTAPTLSTTQPTCTLNTGTITVTSPAPAAGITYSIDGSTYTNTTGVFAGLAVGPYNVTSKNSSGCLTSATPVTLVTPTVKTWTGATDTKWNLAGNWTPSGIPTASDCVVIPNVTNKPILSGTPLVGFAQMLTVDNSASLTVFSANTLNVADAISVGITGSIVFENNSSLLQSNNSPTINTGNITYKRISPQIRVADFTYWSTPVKPQSLFDVSPETLFDKYFGYDGDNWVETNSSTIMTIGKGYIIRGPQSYSRTVKADYTASFIGVPNNGNLSGETLAANKFYLIGNPYPSALNASKFLDANPFINGTLYFWTHNTAVVFSPTYQYNSDDYAAYNITGGTATYPAPSGSIPGNSNNNKPSGMIAAGQSFFTSTGSTGGTVVFDNSMRFGATDNGQFFKPGKVSAETTNRIWLNMTNDGGAFKQLLIGYVEGATNQFDNKYDGLSFDANEYIDFYSINNENNFVIQGRALPFTNSDVVPLGYRTTIEGEFVISIDQVEGDLIDQEVYIEDKATSKIHDLRASDYKFTTAIGTFADRFVLRYTNKTLGVGDLDNLENRILVSIREKVIKVTSSKENLKQVTIFDVSGKRLYDKNKVEATELQLQNLPLSNQVLLVKVVLENGYTTTKKVIFK